MQRDTKLFVSLVWFRRIKANIRLNDGNDEQYREALKKKRYAARPLVKMLGSL